MCIKQTIQYRIMSHKSNHLASLVLLRTKVNMNTKPSNRADYTPNATDIHIKCKCAKTNTFCAVKEHDHLFQGKKGNLLD